MKWGGLDEHAALALITMNPARQLGIDDRVGSLEPGKDADLVIFDGHPLSNLSKVRQTMIDGAIYFDIDLDRDRQQQLEQEKQTLLDKQRTGEGRGGRVVSDRVAPVAPGGGTMKTRAILTALILAVAPPAAAQTTLALTGGEIHTLAGEVIPNGTVVISDGVIQAVGADVDVPAGAQVLDVSGQRVYPGFFDAMTQLGLTEIGQVAVTNDFRELGDFNPHLVAATAVHPASEHIQVARANGVTHAVTAPRAGGRGGGSSGFPGQGTLVHLDGWTIEGDADHALRGAWSCSGPPSARGSSTSTVSRWSSDPIVRPKRSTMSGWPSCAPGSRARSIRCTRQTPGWSAI